MGQETLCVAFLAQNNGWLTRYLGLDEVIPRQLFEVPIQAAVGKKIIARETLSAMRADVTAGLYGGKPVPHQRPNTYAQGFYA